MIKNAIPVFCVGNLNCRRLFLVAKRKKRSYNICVHDNAKEKRRRNGSDNAADRRSGRCIKRNCR